MATTDVVQRPSLTVPAEYLDDLRSAIIAEIREDAKALEAERTALHPDDLTGAAAILRRDLVLLDELLKATDAMTLEAVSDGLSDPLAEMLQAMVRQLSRQLKQLSGYGPLPLGRMLEITERIRWAAREAIRISPSLDERDAVA